MNPIPLNVATPSMAPGMAYQGCCPIMACGSDACPIVQSVKKMNKGMNGPQGSYEAVKHPGEHALNQSRIEIMMGNSAAYAAPEGKPKESQSAETKAPSSYHSLEQAAGQQMAYNRAPLPGVPAQAPQRETYEGIKGPDGKITIRKVSSEHNQAQQAYRAEASRDASPSASQPYQAKNSTLVQKAPQQFPATSGERYASSHARQISSSRQQGIEVRMGASAGSGAYVAQGKGPSQNRAYPSLTVIPAQEGRAERRQYSLDAVVKAAVPEQKAEVSRPIQQYTQQASLPAIPRGQTSRAYAHNASVEAASRAMPKAGSEATRTSEILKGMPKAGYQDASLSGLVAVAYSPHAGERQAPKAEVSSPNARRAYKSEVRENGQKPAPQEKKAGGRTQQQQPIYRAPQQTVEKAVASAGPVLRVSLDYLMGAYAKAERNARAMPGSRDGQDAPDYERRPAINPTYQQRPLASRDLSMRKKAEGKKDNGGEVAGRKAISLPEKILVLEGGRKKKMPILERPDEKVALPPPRRKKATSTRGPSPKSLRTRLQGMDARMLAIAVAING